MQTENPLFEGYDIHSLRPDCLGIFYNSDMKHCQACIACSQCRELFNIFKDKLVQRARDERKIKYLKASKQEVKQEAKQEIRDFISKLSQEELNTLSSLMKGGGVK